jgi:hypothetical protein
MGFDISALLDTSAIGLQVNQITGNAEQSAYAAAYAAWVSAITGGNPTVAVGSSPKQAKLQLTQQQNIAMRHWLDQQVHGILAPTGEPEIVDYGAGEFMGPWAMQYAIPAIIGAFVAGWMARWFIGRR